MLLLVTIFNLLLGYTCLRHVPLTTREIEFIKVLDKSVETVDLFEEDESVCVFTKKSHNAETSGTYVCLCP